MVLFQKSIQKELLKNFSGSTVVLFTIVMTIMLIRILGLASRGQADPAEVILLIGLNGIGNAAPILTLSLFISIVYTFSRMYLDSEMVIWFASGISLTKFLKPVWNFSWPVLITIGLLLFFAWPWSNIQTQYLKERFEKRSDIERIAPGQFQESASSKMVFFIDKLKNNSNESTSVFISKMEGMTETITTAKTGIVETIDNQKYLALMLGQQTVIDHQEGHIHMTEFSQFKYRIDDNAQNNLVDVQSQMMSTYDLLESRTPILLGELFWRLGLLLAAINMTLLAVQLASVNPRIGRSYSLTIAILCFVGYFNAITIGKRMIANQTFGFGESMFVVHGTATLIVVFWFLHTEYNLHWRRLLPSPSI